MAGTGFNSFKELTYLCVKSKDLYFWMGSLKIVLDRPLAFQIRFYDRTDSLNGWCFCTYKG